MTTLQTKILVAAMIAARAVVLSAQSGQPAFDVVSIKLHRPGAPQHEPSFSSGNRRFTSAGMPLRWVIAFAYGFSYQFQHLSGGPDWIKSNKVTYDIEAKVVSDSLPEERAESESRERALQMLQNLLRDRFQLKVHRATADMPVYIVGVAKGGPKLEKSTIEEQKCPQDEVETSASTTCHKLAGGRGRGVRGAAITVGDLLRYLEPWVDRPLIDETGIHGLFNIQTTAWRDLVPGDPDDPNRNLTASRTASDDQPTLFEMFDKLGLRISGQKGRASVIVIDSVQEPSEN